MGPNELALRSCHVIVLAPSLTMGASFCENLNANSQTDLGRLVCWALCNDGPHGPHSWHGVLDHPHSPMDPFAPPPPSL